MTSGKFSAVLLGFVGAFALGVWIGPHLVHRTDNRAAIEATSATAPATAGAKSGDTAAPRAAVVTHAPRVAVSEPALQDRLKPVLNRGADMTVAATGFKNAEDFATVAHAAHNTAVPFLLLKHRVLNEGKSVAEAIRESKPTVNASVEANLARAQARSDIASIAG